MQANHKGGVSGRNKIAFVCCEPLMQIFFLWKNAYGLQKLRGSNFQTSRDLPYIRNIEWT